MSRQADHLEAATAGQAEFIVASRRAAGVRQRALLTGVAAALVIAVTLAVVAIIQRNEAVQQRRTALARGLAIQAQSELATDPSLAGLLSLEAYRLGPTAEAHRTVLSTLAGLRHHMGALRGHTGAVVSVAFSPDGATLASGGSDSTVRLWNVAHHAAIGEPLVGHVTNVKVAFSPDGAMLAATSADFVQLWDPGTAPPVGDRMYSDDMSIDAVAFSPDGGLMATAGADRLTNGQPRLWDVATRLPRGEDFAGHWKEVNSIAFSPDGATLASGSDDGDVRLWEVASGRALASPLTECGDVYGVGPPLCGHDGSVYDVAFSPDGRTVASSGSDRTVHRWDVASRQPLGPPLVGHDGIVTSVAFSPDGATLASAGTDTTIRLWDVAHREPREPPLTGHDDEVYDITFSPDGRTLASAGGDNAVRLWDLALHLEPSAPLAIDIPLQSVAFSPDGTTLAVIADDGIQLWDVPHQRPIDAELRLDYGLTDIAFSPDGTMLAAAGSTTGRSGSLDFVVALWDLAGDRLIGPLLTGHTDYVGSVAFSPDGTMLASAGRDRTVRLWDVERHAPLGQPMTGHTDWIFSVAFSPDGRTLASAGVDRTVRLWDVAEQQALGPALTGHTDTVNDVVFAPGGTLLATAGTDGVVRLWSGPAWSRNFEVLQGEVCARARRNMTRDQWELLLPGEPYRETCPR